MNASLRNNATAHSLSWKPKLRIVSPDCNATVLLQAAKDVEENLHASRPCREIIIMGSAQASPGCARGNTGTPETRQQSCRTVPRYCGVVHHKPQFHILQMEKIRGNFTVQAILKTAMRAVPH
mmetsp:Transcript_71970/g.139073  ORF Transcript_71970/g.139073 Transcript_71970/m.139073 type:complete len:123 (-) Transcript_71970:237-605(-)